MEQKIADEKFTRAEDVSRKAIDRALDTWGQGVTHFPVAGGGFGALVR